MISICNSKETLSGNSRMWSTFTPLFEDSIANNGEPQDFPDFTRGSYIKIKPFIWMKDTY